MMQVPTLQTPQVAASAVQPNYNAVKIDINNPQVNTPGTQQQQAPTPLTAPMYNYPQAQIYEMPQQSVYQPPQQNFSQPPIATTAPSVPQPVIVPQATPAAPATPVAPAATNEQAPVIQAPVIQPPVIQAPAAQPPVAAPQVVEVKAPEVAKPQVDLNAFLAKLANPDYDVQAKGMEEVAELAQTSPQKATELLDVKVIDSLLNIMQTDSSKLQGPSAKQLEIREKILSGKQVTEAETAEANKITPMEQAERNKQYAIYTVAILQKLFGSEIEKMSNTVVPLTELPGAAAIVEQLKNNPNPMVRASSIDALSYIQRSEYKQDLTTLFTVAKKDQEPLVQLAATKALEKLAQVADIPAAPAAANASSTETKKA